MVLSAIAAGFTLARTRTLAAIDIAAEELPDDDDCGRVRSEPREQVDRSDALRARARVEEDPIE